MLNSSKSLRMLLLFVGGGLVATATQAQIQPGTAAAETDWSERSSAAGVFYQNNFSDYVDSEDLRNGATNLTHDDGLREVLLDSARYIAGGQSLRIRTHSNVGANGGAWGDQYKNGDLVNDFYFQVALYLPKETMGWRSKGGDGQVKLVNLERYGGGQVVVRQKKFTGFPSFLTNGSGGVTRFIDDLPYRSSGDWFYQNAIDSGSSLAAGTQEAYWRRYGPARTTASAEDHSYIDNDATANYLYNRNFSWPNPDALESGAVPWNLDGWTVIEVHISTQEGGPQRLKMWAAPYGEPPTLICDIDAPDSDLSQIPNFNPDFYQRFQLLNYDTPRESEAGYRPILDTYFDEVIASSDPIPFPGGYGLESDGGGTEPPSNTDLSSVPAPAWVQEIPAGTWAEVSLNTLADVNPADDPDANPNYPNSAPWRGTSGQRSVIRAWSGGALASGHGTHGSLIAFGGGHDNYYGSEVYAFDLQERVWSRLTDPYPGPFNWPYDNAEYPDGSAIPPHTFDFVEYHPETNSFILMKGQSELGPPSNQTSLDIPHLFDLGTLKWRRGPENVNDVRLYSGGYSSYDSKRDVIWAHGGSGSNNFVSFDPKLENTDGTYGQWNTYPQQIRMTDSQAEYDPDNDILVIPAFRDDNRVAAIDLSNPSERYVWLNESGTEPVKRPAHGWTWSDTRRSLLFFGRSGADVHEFKHTSGDWKTGQWTWNKLISTNNSVTPEIADGDHGVYSRFQVVTYSDAEIAIVVNSVTGPVYAFRVPDPIRPLEPSNLQTE